MKNKYEKIIAYFKNEFANGNIKNGDKILTEKEISEKFEVSRITSKRAIDDLVREGLIERIRGNGSFYQGDRLKETFPQNKSKVIAMIFDMELPFAIDYIKGCSQYLSKKGYLLTPYFITTPDRVEEKMVLEKIKSNEIAGIITYPRSISEQFEFYLTCSLEKIPLVTIDKKLTYFDFDAVVSDNFSGGYQIAEALIKKGHKNIAQIYSEYPSAVSTVIGRMKGNLAAFKKNNIKVNTDYIFYNMKPKDKMIQEDKKILSEFLKKISKDCTAIICENDSIADELKGKVGKIELSGFDNLKKSNIYDVTWLTIEQNFEKIGKEAGRLMVKRIENPFSETTVKNVEVKLIEATK